MNNLFTFSEIKNWLFFDIETVSEYDTLDTLKANNPAKAALWSHRCEYLRRRYGENEILTDDQLYQLKAGLHAEFARIVCIAFGVITAADVEKPATVQIISFKGTDEAYIIGKSLKLIGDFETTVLNKNKSHVARLCGHNIKRFDVPFLFKRAVMHCIGLPDMLLVHNKKPWDMPFMDTSEIWSAGAWQESFASLDLVANALNVPSSKIELDGSMVQSQYWNHNDYDGIEKYCRLDVGATMNIILSLSGYSIAIQS